MESRQWCGANSGECVNTTNGHGENYIRSGFSEENIGSSLIALTKARNPQCRRLVEGGRWLLIASDTSSVAYFDLDASPITENLLIPDQPQIS